MKGISIIIPSYNRREMLTNTLCGLLVQEHFDKEYEVIIVDNGSDDLFSTSGMDIDFCFPIKIIKRNLRSGNFRPGSARNIGALNARHEIIVFLDSDCIPSSTFLSAHWDILSGGNSIATIGHREFISVSNIQLDSILNSPNYIYKVPRVISDSNYKRETDRRLPELSLLKSHPAPFNCFHGCNLGMRKSDFFNAGGFDERFDLFWGYEDIELGYRLSLSHVEFRYVPSAVVFHQEGEGLSFAERLSGRARNFQLASNLMPGFESFRKELGR